MSSMHVLKRNGRKETVHFDKITSRIRHLCYGLDPKVRFYFWVLLYGCDVMWLL